MRSNHVKRRLKDGQSSVGTWLSLPCPPAARYMAQVNRFEAEWRAFFVPRIMSYRGVLPHDYADAPRFAWTDSPPWHAVWRAGLQQLALAAALLGLLWRCRARLGRP